MSYDRAIFYYKLQHILADRNPPSLANKVAEARRVLRAAGHILPDEQPQATEHTIPSATTSPEIPNSKSEIQNSPPPSPPPPEDCSPIHETQPLPTSLEAEAANASQTSIATCNEMPVSNTGPHWPLNIPAPDLLTASHALPVTELHLRSDQPGVSLTLPATHSMPAVASP